MLFAFNAVVCTFPQAIRERIGARQQVLGAAVAGPRSFARVSTDNGDVSLIGIARKSLGNATGCIADITGARSGTKVHLLATIRTTFSVRRLPISALLHC